MQVDVPTHVLLQKLAMAVACVSFFKAYIVSFGYADAKTLLYCRNMLRRAFFPNSCA